MKINTTRKTIVITDDDSSMTLMKPFSQEHQGKLIVIHEDAYGGFNAALTSIEEIKQNILISDEEFNKWIFNL